MSSVRTAYLRLAGRILVTQVPFPVTNANDEIETRTQCVSFDVSQFVVIVRNLIEKRRHLGEDSIWLAQMVNLMAG